MVYFDAENGAARDNVHALVNLIRKELLSVDMITTEECKEDWTMHSTALNVKYRREEGLGKRNWNDHFDATAIFSKYAPGMPCNLLNDVPIQLNSLEVSSLKLDKNTGYYVCDHRESFPHGS